MYIVTENQWPQDRANFDPRAIIWTILLEVHYTMFHAKYLTSGLCQFRKDVFFLQVFTKYIEGKPMTKGLFLTLEQNLNNFGRVPIDDIICQISKPCTFRQ
jgi:hypothetical protein